MNEWRAKKCCNAVMIFFACFERSVRKNTWMEWINHVIKNFVLTRLFRQFHAYRRNSFSEHKSVLEGSCDRAHHLCTVEMTVKEGHEWTNVWNQYYASYAGIYSVILIMNFELLENYTEYHIICQMRACAPLIQWYNVDFSAIYLVVP